VKTPPLRVTLTAIYVLLISLIVAAADLGALPVASIHAIPFGDKISHFLLIGGLAFFINWFLHCQTWRIGGRGILVGSLALATLSIIEETSQIWIPNRRFDLGDMAMNLLGILILGPLARRVCSSAPASDLR
jgi:polysaccharide biosynthesis protein VpsQ